MVKMTCLLGWFWGSFWGVAKCQIGFSDVFGPFGISNTFSILKVCKIVETVQVIGVFVSSCPGTKYGWLHTKQLEIENILALKKFY